MANDKVTVDLTTGVGTLSFPHLFPSTAVDKKDNNGNPTGEKSFDVQILIPKTDRDSVKAILLAIKKVAEAKWGDNWKKVRNPLRDGDKEADDVTDEGKTKGEKYPERLGHYFLNARSTKPVGVFDRQRNPIHDVDAVYGGCKGKINVTFAPYSKQGNSGVGAYLNGVQKIVDGEPFGAGRPSVESMFDLVDEDEFSDLDLDEAVEEEPTPAPAKKAAAKKAAPAKKAAAKKAAAPEPEEDPDDDLADLTGDEGDDMFDDLDD